VKIAIGQMKVGPLDNPGLNMEEACRLAGEAGAAGARLLLLPEGCLTGNALNGPGRQAALPAEAAPFEPLSRIARKTGLTLCAGFTTRLADGFFNVAHAILAPDGSARFQHKAFRASGEPKHLKAWPDPARTAFTVDGRTIVITICSEYGRPDIMESARACRPDLILHPSAGRMNDNEVWRAGHENEPPVRDFLANCRNVVESAAKANAQDGLHRVAANPVGFDGETWWPGNGYAVSGKGEILAWVEGENRPERMLSRLGYVEL
jgi:predicted amidohydrolase